MLICDVVSYELYSVWKFLKVSCKTQKNRDKNIRADIKSKEVNLVTLVEGNPKAPFSIVTTPRCRKGRYSIPRIAPIHPWSSPYNAEC